MLAVGGKGGHGDGVREVPEKRNGRTTSQRSLRATENKERRGEERKGENHRGNLKKGNVMIKLCVCSSLPMV